MKMLKRVMLTVAAGAVALSALVGCSKISTASCTVEGTMTIKNGDTTSAGTVLIASDGNVSYSKYVIDGNVIENISETRYSYDRTYAEGTEGGKWTKSPIEETADTTNPQTGTRVIDGKEYQTVAYDSTTVYCYTGNNLEYIYINDDSGEIEVKITSISSEVDSSLLKIPTADEIA